MASAQTSEKNFTVTLILAILVPGVDRIYTGTVILGVLKFITGGGFGIWWLVDIILLLTGKYKDGSHNIISSDV